MRKDLNVSSPSADAIAELTVASVSVTLSRALHAGSLAPSFVLPDKNGNEVTLDQLLSSGPVVLNFLRGSWCSFGEESLARFLAMHTRIDLAGARAVAIAPPDKSERRRGRFPIPELVDKDLQLATAFGLTFDLPEGLRSRYLDLGYLPPNLRQAGEFLVPVPAIYLLDGHGIVVFAHVDADYRNAFDEESLLKAIRVLRGRRKRAQP